MPREAELSLNEREFILEALRDDVRCDGREFTDQRPITLDFGDDYGYADVSMGKTRVTARISCTVTSPLPDRQFDGILTISSEFFSPMTSPAHEAGRQSESELLLSRLLEKAVRRSGALDTESLCIVAGQSCFAIRADMHVLCHDGNVLDASCLALMAALSHFRRPDVALDSSGGDAMGRGGRGGNNITVFDPQEREPVPLAMLHLPLYVSFSLLDDGEILLVDATNAEEQVRQGEIIVAMNTQGEVCQMAKYGGTPADPMLVLRCCTLAEEKVKSMTNLIGKRLEADARKRNVGDLIAELSAANER